MIYLILAMYLDLVFLHRVSDLLYKTSYQVSVLFNFFTI